MEDRKLGTISANTVPQGAGLHQAGGLGQRPQPWPQPASTPTARAAQRPAMPSACHVGPGPRSPSLKEVRGFEALYSSQ